MRAATGARKGERQDGFAMLAVVVMVLPILFVVGSYLQTMTGRNSRLELEVKEERAMLVAESGVDHAMFQARSGALVADPHAVYHYSGTLAGGGSYTVTCTYLGADGIDNDGANGVDDPNEDVFEVVATGTLGTSQRRICAYLGWSPFLTTAPGALTMVNPNPTDITINGSPTLSGKNYTVAGALVGSGDQPGITIEAPGTTANITGLLTAGEGSHVTGSTAAPSVAAGNTYTAATFNGIVQQARNAAQIVIVNGQVNANTTYGSPAANGTHYIVYRNGDLKINGNMSGAGLLVVNGNLTITGTMTWKGVVLVTGNIDAANGTASVYGGIVMGPGGSTIKMKGTADIRYSAAAIDYATRLTGRYVALNGWQEVTTNNILFGGAGAGGAGG
jgi:hypothetical protein